MHFVLRVFAPFAFKQMQQVRFVKVNLLPAFAPAQFCCVCYAVPFNQVSWREQGLSKSTRVIAPCMRRC